MRKVTMYLPVAEILDGGTKAEFYADLRKSMSLARTIANRSASECLRQDDLSESRCGKLYTYPIVSVIAGKGMSSQAASISRNVEKSYRSDRVEVRSGRRSTRTYRMQPFPLLRSSRGSGDTLHLTDQGEFLVARIRLVGSWWTVRLAGGSRYRYQTDGIRQAIAKSTYGTGEIRIDKKKGAILSVSVSVDEAKRSGLTGTMTVVSSRESLLVATFERSDVPFVINADIVHKWKGESSRQFQRMRQDRKSGVNRRRIREDMNRLSAKMDCRMKTLCHEVAAAIVKKAERLKIKTIVLDLTIKSYAKQFTWFDLAAKIKHKCEMAGMEFADGTLQISEPDVDMPHIYFKYSPSVKRIKIGRTGLTNGSRHGAETDSAEDLVVLAVDNQPKTKLVSKEKHFHALFQEHREKGEWFRAEPILAWLREVEWLGNAGNLSQISQVLDVS